MFVQCTEQDMLLLGTAERIEVPIRVVMHDKRHADVKRLGTQVRQVGIVPTPNFPPNVQLLNKDHVYDLIPPNDKVVLALKIGSGCDQLLHSTVVRRLKAIVPKSLVKKGNLKLKKIMQQCKEKNKLNASASAKCMQMHDFSFSM